MDGSRIRATNISVHLSLPVDQLPIDENDDDDDECHEDECDNHSDDVDDVI